MELEELKDLILRDLNSEDYPFVVEIKGNTVTGRWKNDDSARPFSVKYTLRKDKTFYGGEMTAHRTDYTPPTSTVTRSVYNVTASDNLPWRKNIDPRDRANIGHDEEKLFSIIEHYLMEKGYFYRPGVLNGAYLSWDQGFQLRLVGALFVLVGISLSAPAWGEGLVILHILLFLYTVLGAWILLVGLGKLKFYDLRKDVAAKVILGIIMASWIIAIGFMALEHLRT